MSESSRIRLTVDAEMLNTDARLFQKRFTAILFWRDMREVGMALLLIPLWLSLGQKLALPWTWYLMVPILVWIAGYMLVNRMRNKSRPSEAGEPLGGRLENTLAQVEQQIRLLENGLWWCLLPLVVPMMTFVGHVAWLTGSKDWWTALFVSVAVLFVGGVLFAVHRLNQNVVRTDLLPRREELRTQLLSLLGESAETESLTQE